MNIQFQKQLFSLVAINLDFYIFSYSKENLQKSEFLIFRRFYKKILHFFQRQQFSFRENQHSVLVD